MTDNNRCKVDLATLINKLNDLHDQANGDLARVVELLLLENHVLSLGQSSGFGRGVEYDFSEIPRFLEIT